MQSISLHVAYTAPSGAHTHPFRTSGGNTRRSLVEVHLVYFFDGLI